MSDNDYEKYLQRKKNPSEHHHWNQLTLSFHEEPLHMILPKRKKNWTNQNWKKRRKLEGCAQRADTESVDLWFVMAYSVLTNQRGALYTHAGREWSRRFMVGSSDFRGGELRQPAILGERVKSELWVLTFLKLERRESDVGFSICDWREKREFETLER